MADEAEEIARQFSVSSNDAMQIRLRDPEHFTDSKTKSFHPSFTYPIFGDEEVIFGYKGLKIELDFSPTSMKPRLSISWSEKFVQVGDVKALDVEAILRPYLPSLTQEPEPFDTPPGECVRTYRAQDREFQIWAASLADARALNILRNMQILILFYIEGGSFINLDDPPWTLARWRVFFVYEVTREADQSKATPAYSFVGYSTTYRLFFFDKDEPKYYSLSEGQSQESKLSQVENLTLPARERISQFLILPQYQNGGHGSQLYNTIVLNLIGIPIIKEITVEDPNETFDDMRDVNDLIRLRRNVAFDNLSINPNITVQKAAPIPIFSIVPRTTLDILRKETKTARRQFARLVEMHTLSKIPPLHRSLSRITRRDKTLNDKDRAYFFWRLLVKERLYRHNKEILVQLDLEERLIKLDETVVGVERDYLRLLAKADSRLKTIRESDDTEGQFGGAHEQHAVNTNGSGRVRLKRKIIEDDDEEEEGGVGNGADKVDGSKRHKGDSL